MMESKPETPSRWKSVVTLVATLAGIATIFGIFINLAEQSHERKRWVEQYAKLDAQIAYQQTQIALSEDEKKILAELGTVTAEQLGLPTQYYDTPNDDADLALKATASAQEILNLAATRQALDDQRRRVEATQTAVMKSPPPTAMRPIPTTAESAAALFGGPSAMNWKPCPGEPTGCWTFATPGTSFQIVVPVNCLHSDGSIDGWRKNGGYPGQPDSIQGTSSIWTALEGATIRCAQ